jgi:carbamoyl-phosphate synthase large subunit
MRAEKMRLTFTKMNGTSNDYIYFNCFGQQIDAPESLSVYLSDLHGGVGGDGVILICPSETADAKMRIFNRDGSEGKMCGNGIRCVGKYLYDNGFTDKTDLTIETLSGNKHLRLYVRGGKVKSVTVDMGKAELSPEKIPVRLEGGCVVGKTVEIEGKPFKITCVSMGNPHCVVFQDNLDLLEIETVGPAFENAPIFPERVNTEFVKVVDGHTLKMRVWERGSGETLACGTGACAAVVAAVENGFCEKGEDITVRLRGGDLLVRYTDETVFMTGDARKNFEGVAEL